MYWCSDLKIVCRNERIPEAMFRACWRWVIVVALVAGGVHPAPATIVGMPVADQGLNDLFAMLDPLDGPVLGVDYIAQRTPASGPAATAFGRTACADSECDSVSIDSVDCIVNEPVLDFPSGITDPLIAGSSSRSFQANSLDWTGSLTIGATGPATGDGNTQLGIGGGTQFAFQALDPNQPVGAPIAGEIVLVERGSITFTSKSPPAIADAGASMILNNPPTGPPAAVVTSIVSVQPGTIPFVAGLPPNAVTEIDDPENTIWEIDGTIATTFSGENGDIFAVQMISFLQLFAVNEVGVIDDFNENTFSLTITPSAAMPGLQFIVVPESSTLMLTAVSLLSLGLFSGPRYVR